MACAPNSCQNAAARAFVRSLNLLLKYSRLYGCEHARTQAQFSVAWSELSTALAEGGANGVLLGVTGADLLLDGVPLGAGSGEKSLAQLLGGLGIASIHFTREMHEEDFARLEDALLEAGKKNSKTGESLKGWFGQDSAVRVNQVRFVARSGEESEASALATELALKSLGPDAGQLQDWLKDPHKLLQVIAAAEGSRLSGTFPAPTTGMAPAPATATGVSPAAPSASGFAGSPFFTPAHPLASPPSPASGQSLSAPQMEEQEIALAFKLLGMWGEAKGPAGAEAALAAPGASLNELRLETQRAMRNALLSMESEVESERPMLLQLAEHLAIRFALDRFERGDMQVNAVREMLNKMSQQMESLRRVLASHEDQMAKAGLSVENHAQILDRQFWAAMPEKGKRSVLLSSDAWCIPPANVAAYLEELSQRGEQESAAQVLASYAACARSQEVDGRRRAALGLTELAGWFARFPAVLESALAGLAHELAREQEPEMQKLLGSAFVRLNQEAVNARCYIAVQQGMEGVEQIEQKLPELGAHLRPRLGLYDKLPELVAEAIHSPAESADLLEMLRAVPQAATEKLISHFDGAVRRNECERIVTMMGQLGPAALQHLRAQLAAEDPEKAVLAVGLLSRLDPTLVERTLAKRLHSWAGGHQDHALRQIAAASAADRGHVLLKLLDCAHPELAPQIVDEIGLSGDRGTSARLMTLAFDAAASQSPYLQVKAIEALGRMRELKAESHLRRLVESREFLHWIHPRELRIAAAQALLILDPGTTRSFLAHKGFTPTELALGPLPRMEQCRWARQRRYARLPQAEEVPARLELPQKQSSLHVEQLSLGGGLATAEAALPSGTAAELDIRSGLHHIHAHVWLRHEQANRFSFEILNIGLEDRSRLRRLLSHERISLPAALFDRQSAHSLRLALR